MFTYPDFKLSAHRAFDYYNFSDHEVYMFTKERFFQVLDIEMIRGAKPFPTQFEDDYL